MDFSNEGRFASIAPICFIAFKRPDHTQKALEALANNPIAKDTEVYAFVDGPRLRSDIPLVERTVEVIRAATGFKSLKLVQRHENWGLAKSITAAVSEVVNAHGRVIVIEDDVLVSPAFLSYMNKGLGLYELNEKVWHISGYATQYPEMKRGAHPWRLMNCWGWATWRDRWAHFEKNTDELLASFSQEEIHRFNIDGMENFWAQVQMNKTGQLNTWAIFWYASIFRRGGLCMSPWHSYVRNIGFDGSGENCVDLGIRDQAALNMDFDPPLPLVEAENPWAVKRYQLSLIEKYCVQQQQFENIPKVQAAISQVVAQIA